MEAKSPLAAALGRIHQQDCVAGMNTLPAGSVDLVFADPPFNIGYDYDVYHDRKEYADYLAWSRQWIGAVHRVLKPDGTFWLAIGDEYAAELKLASQEIGFHIRSWVIWYYTFGVNCKTKFSRSHAHLFHFVKDPKRFTFRAEELENRIPSARLLVYGDKRGNPDGRLPDDTWVLRPQDLSDRFTPDEDTWYFPRVAGTFKERRGFHGCQMPEQLLGRIIRICSREGETVLDPFSGSATTLAVAKKMGRAFLGFDLSPEYVAQGTKRLSAIRITDRLEGATEPTMSAPATSKGRTKKKTDKTPLEEVLTASSRSSHEKSKRDFFHGLVEAFCRTNRGFSLDRVIADPELNAALDLECKKLDLPGEIRLWNLNLFRARKAGMLSDIPTTQRTEVSWEDCDSFLFASEIAWKQMLDKGCKSLDDILCDPPSAAEFDLIAKSLAPGFTSLEYRWGALKLRKESRRAKNQASLLTTKQTRVRFTKSIPVFGKNLLKIPEQSGIYLLLDRQHKKELYVGETLNLRSRLCGQFSLKTRKTWNAWANDISVEYFTADSEIPLLFGYQSLYIREFRPKLNLPELALT